MRKAPRIAGSGPIGTLVSTTRKGDKRTDTGVAGVYTDISGPVARNVVGTTPALSALPSPQLCAGGENKQLGKMSGSLCCRGALVAMGAAQPAPPTRQPQVGRR